MLKEHELILKVILLNKSDIEEKEIDELIRSELNWSEIAGQVINHRLCGYFYYGLKKEQLKYLPQEFYIMLELIVDAQKQQMAKRSTEINLIVDKLNQYNVRYVGLKGIIFCADFYEVGMRRSNDIDLMVLEEDIDLLDKALRELGYCQSFYRDGKLVEATKREKLIQRMNYHDLVPYLKISNNEILELDINFKFDSKENVIDNFIYENGIVKYSNSLYSINGLPFETHLIFLCIHFYREATNTLWTNGRRDVLLYKIADIINLCRAHGNDMNFKAWCELIKKLKVDNKCYLTFKIINKIYPSKFFSNILDLLDLNTSEEDLQILVDGENRYVKREKEFCEDIFNWTYSKK